MINIIKKEARLIAILGLSISLSLALSFLRFKLSGNIHYGFLIWNLILAGIPLVIALVLHHKMEKIKTIVLLLMIGMWLLFFPNAPYIITDIFHLRPRDGIALWYDLILIVSYAWNGLILGFYSLWHIKELVRKKWNKGLANTLIFISLFLAGFGVYLGRYLRWNSWDIILNPQRLALDILNRILHPFQHTATWSMTIIFASFLIIAYLSITHFGYLHLKSRQNESPEKQ
ncbi:MAG: DUF1361 domain-containing protein [Flavobacteriales bacterium]|nr:DUF1361 domain-containing protein [Flavobacteriales bacterium]